MKFYLKKMSICIVLFISVPSLSFASGSKSANAVKVLSIVGYGAALTYTVVNFNRCYQSWSGNGCAEAVEGLKQMEKFKESIENSGQIASKLSNGGDGSLGIDSNEAGFCFDPSKDCTPDAIDENTKDFKTVIETGKGLDGALAAVGEKLSKMKAEAEKKGFKIDLEAGTMTDKNGKVTDLNDQNKDMQKYLSKSTSGRANKVRKAIGIDGSASLKRKVASAAKFGGSTGGNSKTASSMGLSSFGVNFSKENDLKKKKDDKRKFLASLTDEGVGKNGVGFAGDDIFNMIQRRYNKKIERKEFLNK